MLHRGERRTLTTKQVRETEAEAVAFVVCQAVGLETGTASQDYVGFAVMLSCLLGYAPLLKMCRLGNNITKEESAAVRGILRIECSTRLVIHSGGLSADRLAKPSGRGKSRQRVQP